MWIRSLRVPNYLERFIWWEVDQYNSWYQSQGKSSCRKKHQSFNPFMPKDLLGKLLSGTIFWANEYFNPYAAGEQCKMMLKNWKMTKTLAYGYSSESAQRELSNEYHGLYDFLKSCVLVLWRKVASALVKPFYAHSLLLVIPPPPSWIWWQPLNHRYISLNFFRLKNTLWAKCQLKKSFKLYRPRD